MLFNLHYGYRRYDLPVCNSNKTYWLIFRYVSIHIQIYLFQSAAPAMPNCLPLSPPPPPSPIPIKHVENTCQGSIMNWLLSVLLWPLLLSMLLLFSSYNILIASAIIITATAIAPFVDYPITCKIITFFYLFIIIHFFSLAS